MSKFRQEPRYNISEAIEVSVNFRKLFVFLDVEVVVQEVKGRNGRTTYRRITNRQVETSAILRASGIKFA